MRLLSHPRALALLVAAAFFMEFLDGTVIATALPQMATSFGVRPLDLSVGMSAYLLTLAVFLPASGFAADRFGARSVFCAALVIFTLASVACGLAPDVRSFTAARVVQGLGGALMVPVGRLVVLRTTVKADLMSAIATLTWPALAAPILAPPLGGFLTTYASWRWIFFINVPLGLAALFAAWRIVPEGRPASVRPFDGLGFLLTGLVGLSFMSAMDMLGQESLDWPMAGGLLCLSTVFGVLAGRHLLGHAAPIVDLRALAIPSFAVSIFGGSLYRISASTLPFLLPLLLQIGFGYDAFHAGLIVLSLFVGNVGMKPLTTPVLRRFGFRKTLIGCSLLLTVSFLLCALIGPATPLAIVVPIVCFSGAVRSMGFTAYNTIVFADIEPAALSGANTLFNVAQQTAFGLGIVIGALVLRVAEIWRPAGSAHATPMEFSIAFALVSLLALASIVDALRLPGDVGAEVTRGRRVGTG